ASRPLRGCGRACQGVRRLTGMRWRGRPKKGEAAGAPNPHDAYRNAGSAQPETIKIAAIAPAHGAKPPSAPSNRQRFAIGSTVNNFALLYFEQGDWAHAAQ